MKTMKFYLCIAFISIFTGTFSTVVTAAPDELYITTMEKTLTKMDNSRSVEELLQCRNTFERVANKYETEWMPLYYVAYCDIQMVFFQPTGEENSKRLEDAKIYLDKLTKNENADKSEVYTLWGYYYNALIVLNPQANGQKYFNEVIGSYEKALGFNAENPRAIILLAFFEQQMPAFYKSPRNAATEVEKAKALFEKEEKSINSPYWGTYFFNMIKI